MGVAVRSNVGAVVLGVRRTSMTAALSDVTTRGDVAISSLGLSAYTGVGVADLEVADWTVQAQRSTGPPAHSASPSTPTTG